MVGPRVLVALTVFGAVVVHSAMARAEVVNVLVVDRDVATDAGFGAGGRYQDAYHDMMDPTNFGPTGLVNRSFQFLTPVSSLSGVSLDNVGLVILAHSHMKSISGGDIQAIADFVYSDGGGLLGLGHSFSTIETGGGEDQVCYALTNRFANSWGTGSGTQYRTPSGANMTVADVGSGPASGPFGELEGATVRSDVNAYWSGSTSSSTGNFALDYDTVGLDGLHGEFGAGRYMMIGGINAIGDGDDGSSMQLSRYDEASNSAFFLNTIDYLTANSPAGSESTSAPEPSSFALLAAAGIAAIARQRRRRRRLSRRDSES